MDYFGFNNFLREIVSIYYTENNLKLIGVKKDNLRTINDRVIKRFIDSFTDQLRNNLLSQKRN